MTSRADAPPRSKTADARAERRVLATTLAVVGTLFAAATTTQSVMALGIFSPHLRSVDASPVAELVTRGLINLATVAVVGTLAMLVDLARHRPLLRVTLATIIAVLGGVFRAVAQMASGLYPHTAAHIVVAEIGTTTAASLVTLAIALVVTLLWRRQRCEQRQREENLALALAAHDELRTEEIRVRREVAQELHGTVQGALVIAEARVRRLTTRGVDAAELEAVAESLREIRDEQLRRLTSRLFPAELDRGVQAALDALIARLPASIDVEDDYREGTAILDARRKAATTAHAHPAESDGLGLLLVHIVEEAVTNALKHGAVSRIRIAVRVTEPEWVDVTVADDGVGIDAGAVRSGLDRLARRARLRGGVLTATAGGIGERGSTVRAHLPLDDAPVQDAPD